MINSSNSARFWAKVSIPDPESGCMLWTAAKAVGYGRFKIDGTLYQAHRLVYQYYVGPNHDDVVIDHICHKRACVNPTHLQVLSREENSSKMPEGFVRPKPERWTHCAQGHDLSEPGNTYMNGTRQRCKICHREKMRRLRAKWRNS